MLLSRLDAIEAAKRKDSELKKAKESKSKSEKAKKSKSEEKDSKSKQEPLSEDEEKPSPKGERKAKSSYESDRSSFKSKSDCGSSHELKKAQEHEERKKKSQERMKKAQEHEKRAQEREKKALEREKKAQERVKRAQEQEKKSQEREKTAQESSRDQPCGRTQKQFKSQGSYSRAGCGWCGFWKRHDKNHCRARDKTCYSCNKAGHFARVCRNRGRSSRPKVQGQEGQQGQGRRGRWNFNRAQNVSNSERNWRWQSNEVKVDKGQKKTFPDAVKKTSYTEAVKQKACTNLDARVKTKPRAEVNSVRSEGIKKRSPDIAKSAKQSRNYQPRDKFWPGQQVFVQDQQRWTERAVIIRRGRNQREFIIRMSSGVEWHRNRRSPRLGPSPHHEPIKVAPQHERTSCEGNARSSSSAPIQLRSILKKTGTFQEPPWSQKG